MNDDEEFINVVKSFGLKIKIITTSLYSIIKCLYDNVVLVSKIPKAAAAFITNPKVITLNESGNFEILYENYLDEDKSSIKCETFEELKETLRSCLKELKEKKIKWEKEQLDKEFKDL